MEIRKIGNLQVMLDLSGNFLSGSIPFLLGDLMMLEVLNLSNNQLSGQVPDEIGDLRSLAKLNLSNNFLQGQLPLSASKRHWISFVGNPGLSRKPLAPCSQVSLESSRSRRNQLTKRAVAGISIAIVLSLILLGGITFLVLLKIYDIWAKEISSSSSIYHGHDFELNNEECKQTFESMVEETYITQDDYNTGSFENHNLP